MHHLLPQEQQVLPSTTPQTQCQPETNTAHRVRAIVGEEGEEQVTMKPEVRNPSSRQDQAATCQPSRKEKGNGL